jgi:putative transposase
VCAALELALSSYYYEPAAKEEADVVRAIEEIAQRFPTYGSRRIAHQLRRPPYGLAVNRKRVQRIMRERGLVCRRRKASQRTTNSCHPFARFGNLVAGLVIARPDQVRVCDITYIKLGAGEFVYLAIVMDVFTRWIRGWSLSRGLGVELSLAALGQAFRRGVPEVHHSDQGVQYACPGYVAQLQARNVGISMAEVGQAEQNGYAERVIRTIKEEEVYLNEYQDYEEARARIGDFIEAVYNRKRIHSSLGYLTPAEFEAKWRKQQAASQKKATQPTVQI